MAATFHLSILAPEKSMFEGEVEYAEVPGSAGYLGELAHHAALVTGLAQGKLTVRKEDRKVETGQVSGGLFEVGNNRATVLADSVEMGRG